MECTYTVLATAQRLRQFTLAMLAEEAHVPRQNAEDVLHGTKDWFDVDEQAAERTYTMHAAGEQAFEARVRSLFQALELSEVERMEEVSFGLSATAQLYELASSATGKARAEWHAQARDSLVWARTHAKHLPPAVQMSSLARAHMIEALLVQGEQASARRASLARMLDALGEMQVTLSETYTASVEMGLSFVGNLTVRTTVCTWMVLLEEQARLARKFSALLQSMSDLEKWQRKRDKSDACEPESRNASEGQEKRRA